MVTTGKIIKKSIGLIVLAALLYLSVPAGYKAYQNYNGVCLAEGRVLTDDELIRRVTEAINENRWVNIQDEGVMRPILSYGNVKEFILANPNCCLLNLNSPHELHQPTLQEIFSGLTLNTISLDYVIRYKASDGQIKYTEIKQDAYVTNCGDLYMGD